MYMRASSLALRFAAATTIAWAATPTLRAHDVMALPTGDDSADKDLLSDAREIVNLVRDVRDLLKTAKSTAISGDYQKDLPFDPNDVHEMIDLIREVRDLVEESPKSTKSVSVPDLGGLIRTTAPILGWLKSDQEFQAEKFGLVEVATTVALVRQLGGLIKSKSETSGDEKFGIAEVAIAVGIAREVHDLLKAVPIDENKDVQVGVSVSVGIKSTDKDLLSDARDVVNIVRSVRDLLKTTKSAVVSGVVVDDKQLPFDPNDVREMIDLVREVRDLIQEAPKSNKIVSVPDLGGLIATTSPIHRWLLADRQFQAEKLGLADVAAAVALARQLGGVVKAKSETSGDEKFGIAEVAAAVAIAREVHELLKAVPVDETKCIEISPQVKVSVHSINKEVEQLELTKFDAIDGLRLRGEGASRLGLDGGDADVDLDKFSAQSVGAELLRRGNATVAGSPLKQALLADIKALNKTSVFHDGLHIDFFDRDRFPRLAPELGELKKFSNEKLLQKADDEVKRIYGPDDRLDVRDWVKLRDRQIALGGDTKLHDGILRNVQATCCIVEKAQVHAAGSGYNVDMGRFNVCSEETFADQPVMSFCSGFLVAGKIVVTAGHCVDSGNVQEKAFIFGFQMPDSGTLSVGSRFQVAKDQVYFGEELLGRRLDEPPMNTRSDFAVVRLDRAVAGRAPVSLSSRTVQADDLVYTIGHPCGLPMKIANNGVVRTGGHDEYFTTNLDTYGGNSGSQVCLEDTHEVVGILVRGGKDFQYVTLQSEVDGSLCRRSVFAPADDRGGEDVTRVSEFRSIVAPYIGP